MRTFTHARKRVSGLPQIAGPHYAPRGPALRRHLPFLPTSGLAGAPLANRSPRRRSRARSAAASDGCRLPIARRRRARARSVTRNRGLGWCFLFSFAPAQESRYIRRPAPRGSGPGTPGSGASTTDGGMRGSDQPAGRPDAGPRTTRVRRLISRAGSATPQPSTHSIQSRRTSDVRTAQGFRSPTAASTDGARRCYRRGMSYRQAQLARKRSAIGEAVSRSAVGRRKRCS